MERPRFILAEQHTREEVDNFADCLLASEFMGLEPADFDPIIIPRMNLRERLITNLQETINKAKLYVYGGLASGGWNFLWGSVSSNNLDWTGFIYGAPIGIWFVYRFRK